jgi:hypothetical protein
MQTHTCMTNISIAVKWVLSKALNCQQMTFSQTVFVLAGENYVSGYGRLVNARCFHPQGKENGVEQF